MNASPDPWVHGYVGPGAMGTDFEVDDYDKPTVLCLVSLSGGTVNTFPVERVEHFPTRTAHTSLP